MKKAALFQTLFNFFRKKRVDIFQKALDIFL